jgi:hypothetical protein
VDRAEKMDLLRGAQRLAAMSEGRISADAALKALISKGLSEEIPGAGYRSDVEEEMMASFGANQDDFQSDGGLDQGDYERMLNQEKSNIGDDILAAKREKNYKQVERLSIEQDRLARREAELPAASSAGRLAPKAALANALSQLEQAADIYGYDAFPGAADVAGRLEETLQDGKISKEAAESLASELVRRDAERFQPFYKNVNNVKAQIRYEQALRNGEIVMPDVFSKPDKIVRPVSEIFVDQPALLRASSAAPYGPIDLKDIKWQNIDPVTGADLSPPSVQGPVMPKRQVAEFINKSFDSLDPNKSSPQVSINEVLGKVNAGIADLGGVSKVENAGDLTAFAKKFVGWAKNEERKTGRSPIMSWREGGTNPKPIPVSKATIDDVLTTIGLGAADQKRLGYALGQVALAGNAKTAMPEDFMYDSGASNPYEQKIEYQRVIGDNRGTPGTRGVPGSTPPVRIYSIGVKGNKTEGPAVFDQNSRTYKPMLRTKLSKLIEGPQALLAADAGLDRTKPRYNKFGVTDSPRALRELIVDQAAERAAKTGKDLNLERAMSNAEKAIAVTRSARRDNAARKEKNRSLMRFGPYNRLLRGGF